MCDIVLHTAAKIAMKAMKAQMRAVHRPNMKAMRAGRKTTKVMKASKLQKAKAKKASAKTSKVRMKSAINDGIEHEQQRWPWKAPMATMASNMKAVRVTRASSKTMKSTAMKSTCGDRLQFASCLEMAVTYVMGFLSDGILDRHRGYILLVELMACERMAKSKQWHSCTGKGDALRASQMVAKALGVGIYHPGS